MPPRKVKTRKPILAETDFGQSLTKIIATVGPASSSEDTLRKLIAAGVSIFRLNFSHGALEEQSERVALIRKLGHETKQPLAIMGDLPGPKIRVGHIENDGLEVTTGSTVIVCAESDIREVDVPQIPCTYSGIAKDAKVGERILINDGAVRMLIVSKSSNALNCTVTTGGRITTGKGVNLPDSQLEISIPTNRDLECAEWSIRHELDFLAQSFVRTAEEVNALRVALGHFEKDVEIGDSELRIITKIELPAAVKNIDSIVEAADAIMVARGDLGVEMDPTQIPIIQKQLLHVAQSYGKPTIVATQMLESMIKSPSPTRAEVSDIAGAIEDGADVLMLSGETAIGAYPDLAVEHMRRVACYMEDYLAGLPPKASAPQKLVETGYRTAALAHGVWTIAQDIDAKFIVVWSEHGGGARYLSQNNFVIPIIAFTSDERVARQMQILRGVFPVCISHPTTVEDFGRFLNKYLVKAEFAELGDAYILVAGEPLGTPGVTNRLAIHKVGEQN